MRILLMHCCRSHHTAAPQLLAACTQLMHSRPNKFKAPRNAAATVPHASSSSNTGSTTHEQQQPALPKVIVITGPTAVGKTQLGLELAKRLGGEIISADSVQVYTGLDVGSDKLPVEQRQGVPHHLIDILDPSEEFSAGDFHRLGRQVAEDIIARGKVPIVAGGTGFYLRWFVFGRPNTPASTPEAAAKALELLGQAWVQAAAQVAAEQQQALHTDPDGAPTWQQQPVQQQQTLQQQQQKAHTREQPTSSSTHQSPPQQQQQKQHKQSQAAAAQADAAAQALAKLPPVSPEAFAAAQQLSDQQRWDAALGVVQQLGDPETAERIRGERNNWYRLQRVMQILLQNGNKPLSQMDIDTTRELDYDFRCFFLHRPRIELFDRVIYRVEEMVAGGLLQEALMLLDRGITANSNIASRAIGYRQALEFLQAALAKGSASPEELRAMIFDIATASRNLVKSQTTWFRNDAMFRSVDVSGRDTDDVLQELLAELDKPQHIATADSGDSSSSIDSSCQLDKATREALKRYAPQLKIFNDPDRVAAVLDWVQEVAAARNAGQQAAGSLD